MYILGTKTKMARLKWQTLCVMSYDNWKLSNPIDDGYVYQMVSLCCGTEYDEDDTGTNCLCCGEECNIIEDYEYKQIRYDEYLENKADAKRKYNE